MIGETTFSASVRFENGEARVKVIGITPYGSRSVTVSADVADEKISAAIAKPLEAAIKSVREELQQLAYKEAARAVVAASDNGEVI